MTNNNELPKEIFLTRESDNPNDVKVWGMEVYNSTQYTRTDTINQWQPIETAPEGKDILIYAEETGECFVAWWGTEPISGKHDWVIARANDGTCFICKKPTHWMPLPDAPKKDGA